MVCDGALEDLHTFLEPQLRLDGHDGQRIVALCDLCESTSVDQCSETALDGIDPVVHTLDVVVEVVVRDHGGADGLHFEVKHLELVREVAVLTDDELLGLVHAVLEVNHDLTEQLDVVVRHCDPSQGLGSKALAVEMF